ncbi:MAG: hypothetical protein ABIS18_07035 [Actinomycetota bacterium]
MAEFWLGMLTLVFWVLVLLRLGFMLHNRSRHPFRTIHSFKRAAKALVPPQIPPQQVPAEPEPVLDLDPPGPPGLPQPIQLPEPLVRDVEVIAAPSGPRRYRGLTYIVVDEDGIPES